MVAPGIRRAGTGPISEDAEGFDRVRPPPSSLFRCGGRAFRPRWAAPPGRAGCEQGEAGDGGGGSGDDGALQRGEEHRGVDELVVQVGEHDGEGVRPLVQVQRELR